MLTKKALSRTIVATCAAALALAAPAAAGTHQLSGKQITVDEEAGVYKMRGSLIGSWKITGFEELGTSPVYHAKGTEAFRGCLDRRRDGSCKGDPSGTLALDFEFWALFRSDDPASLVWGACFHPITSGTGDFAGAEGVIQMVDTPTGNGVKTRYIGNLKLRGSGARRAAAASRPSC